MMKKNTIGIVGLVIVLLSLLLIWSIIQYSKQNEPYEETVEGDRWNMNSKFYSFTMNNIDGIPVSLSEYQGKVLLVVNVASKCGFTKQYADLQQLYETYQEQGFLVLGFPANNFLSQEPGTDAEIKSFCTTNFNVTFPMFSKISVKGKELHPLYQYLTDPEQNGEFGTSIQWNFNKFLIDKNGNTIGYFESKINPLDTQITDAVEKALKEDDKGKAGAG